MNIQDIRIGNYLQFPEGVYPVTIIDGQANTVFCAEMSYGVPVAELKGVALTPELLEKYGFEQGENHEYKPSGNYSLKTSRGYIYVSNGYFYDKGTYVYSGLGDPESYGHLVPCEYLHQLQNLYYSLTGEEIKIIKNEHI